MGPAGPQSSSPYHPPSSYSCRAPPSALGRLATRDTRQEAENDGDEGEDEQDWVSGPAVEVPRVEAAADGGGEEREDSNGQDELGDSKEMGDAVARAGLGQDAASKTLSLKRKHASSVMRAASMRKVNDHLRI